MRFIDVTKYSRYGLTIGMLMSGLWIGCAGAPPDAGAAGGGQSAAEAPGEQVGEDPEAFTLCGASGKPCCGAGQCNAGLFCIGNTCSPLCGGAGQTCCAGERCNGGLACNPSNICRTCGASGDICCAGNTCSGGLTCSGGRCSPPPCGAAHQTCCNTRPLCGYGLTCLPRTNTCDYCGTVGEACCDGNTCSFGTCDTLLGLCR
jgi:hypothetical protein